VCAPDSGDVTKLDIKLAARIDSAVIDMAFAG
jgi:pterin-4a-carbinolamine dehydratase